MMQLEYIRKCSNVSGGGFTGVPGSPLTQAALGLSSPMLSLHGMPSLATHMASQAMSQQLAMSSLISCGAEELLDKVKNITSEVGRV